MTIYGLMFMLEMVLDEFFLRCIYGARYQFSFLRAWVGHGVR
jgi:hypothetical protein